MDPQLTLCHSNLLSHQINMIVILHKLSKVLTKQFIVFYRGVIAQLLDVKSHPAYRAGTVFWLQ